MGALKSKKNDMSPSQVSGSQVLPVHGLKMRYFLLNFFEKNKSYRAVIRVMVVSLIKEVRS